MSLENSYLFFISQNAATAGTAVEDIKAFMGKEADLVTVPYFELPSHGERFKDTKARFPQLKQLKHKLETSDNVGSRYWFARVLPEKEGGQTEYLAINYPGLTLFREYSIRSERYIGTLILDGPA